MEENKKDKVEIAVAKEEISRIMNLGYEDLIFYAYHLLWGKYPIDDGLDADQTADEVIQSLDTLPETVLYELYDLLQTDLYCVE